MIAEGRSWSDHVAPNQPVRAGFIQVDTDNDRVPDTFLPGTSVNFFAGASSRPRLGGKGPVVQISTDGPCYNGGGKIHCPE